MQLFFFFFAARLQLSSQRKTESRPDPELENEPGDKVLSANRGVLCSGSAVCVENRGKKMEQRRAKVFL